MQSGAGFREPFSVKGFPSIACVLQERKKGRRLALFRSREGRRVERKKKRAISSTQITPHNVIGPLAMP